MNCVGIAEGDEGEEMKAKRNSWKDDNMTLV